MHFFAGKTSLRRKHFTQPTMNRIVLILITLSFLLLSNCKERLRPTAWGGSYVGIVQIYEIQQIGWADDPITHNPVEVLDTSSSELEGTHWISIEEGILNVSQFDNPGRIRETFDTDDFSMKEEGWKCYEHRWVDNGWQVTETRKICLSAKEDSVYFDLHDDYGSPKFYHYVFRGKKVKED